MLYILTLRFMDQMEVLEIRFQMEDKKLPSTIRSAGKNII